MKCKKFQRDSVVNILGHKVDLSKIKNPTLKQILNRNSIKGFLFGYDDNHTDVGRKYSETHRVSYSDKTYYDYNEHKDNHTDVYRDYGHSDYNCNSSSGPASHGDSGDGGHYDKGYSEHTEQSSYR